MIPFAVIFFLLAGLDCICQPTIYWQNENPGLRICESRKPVIIPGRTDDYIISKQNDTLRVQFVIPLASEMPFGDSIWIQDRIIIQKGDITHEILPEHIRGFVYNGNYHEAVWLPDTTKGSALTVLKKFCKRLLDGAIPVYACNSVGTQPDGSKTIHSQLIYKQGGQYKHASRLNFTQGISRILSASSTLTEKTRRGDFNRQDFLTVVLCYNKYFEPKTSH